jgi:hypothetical protein
MTTAIEIITSAAFIAARKANPDSCWLDFTVGEPGAPLIDVEAQAQAEAARLAAKREESFNRCDTDGFLTQYFDGVKSAVNQIGARIARDGGLAVHPGLYDVATGERVPAVLVEGRFGPQWQLCDPATGRALPEWIADRRGPKAALAKRGWVVLGEWAKSEAKLCGEGCGLSGSVWSAAVRTDGGYPGRRPVRPARAA